MTEPPPQPPIPLSGTGLARWRELTADRPWKSRELVTLAAYCAVYGRWVSAEEWLADPAHGPVVTIRNDKGEIKSHGPAPQLAIAERCGKEVARLACVLKL